MTKPARIRQIDITRAIRAATAAGLKVVAVKPDGTVLTASQDERTPEFSPPPPPVDRKRVIVSI